MKEMILNHFQIRSKDLLKLNKIIKHAIRNIRAFSRKILSYYRAVSRRCHLPGGGNDEQQRRSVLRQRASDMSDKSQRFSFIVKNVQNVAETRHYNCTIAQLVEFRASLNSVANCVNKSRDNNRK